MIDPRLMLAWAVAIDDAAVALRAALERVELVGGAAAAAECAAAQAAAAKIPPPFENQPTVQTDAAQRLTAATAALAAIPALGEGDARLRAVHLAEIECAMHAAASRAQAARFVAFAGAMEAAGPIRPALVAWSCHWDALAYHHEALGRLVAGIDRDGVDPALAQGLSRTLDTMAEWIDATEAAFTGMAVPDVLDAALKASYRSFGDTIAVDRAALEVWRTLAANPQLLVDPPGLPALNRLRELDEVRSRLHSARMEAAAQLNATN